MALSQKSRIVDERGFAFIAALLAMLLLAAIGILIFTLSTRDVRTTIRLMGEKKAFSAAETGVHRIMQNFDPGVALIAPDAACPGLGGFFTASTTDTASCYSFTTPVPPASGSAFLPMAGYSITGGEVWGMARYSTTVTGRHTNFQSMVVIDTGIGHGPIDSTTLYR